VYSDRSLPIRFICPRVHEPEGVSSVAHTTGSLVSRKAVLEGRYAGRIAPSLPTMRMYRREDPEVPPAPTALRRGSDPFPSTPLRFRSGRASLQLLDLASHMVLESAHPSIPNSSGIDPVQRKQDREFTRAAPVYLDSPIEVLSLEVSRSGGSSSDPDGRNRGVQGPEVRSDQPPLPASTIRTAPGIAEKSGTWMLLPVKGAPARVQQRSVLLPTTAGSCSGAGDTSERRPLRGWASCGDRFSRAHWVRVGRMFREWIEPVGEGIESNVRMSGRNG
jgi:hypothetical protein